MWVFSDNFPYFHIHKNVLWVLIRVALYPQHLYLLRIAEKLSFIIKYPPYQLRSSIVLDCTGQEVVNTSNIEEK